jgi:hypothetical protein
MIYIYRTYDPAFDHLYFRVQEAAHICFEKIDHHDILFCSEPCWEYDTTSFVMAEVCLKYAIIDPAASKCADDELFIYYYYVLKQKRLKNI